MIARAVLILALVVWLWATSASPALADPISAAVVTYLGVTGTAAAVTAFVVRQAIYSFASWGLSRIGRALSRGRDGAQERQATVTTLSVGEVPREVVFGRQAVGGSLIDAFNFGGEHGTDTVVRVIALADHEITQLEGIFVDDAYQGFGANGVQLGFNGKLDIEFVNASASGGVPPTRFASAGGWTAADKLIGVAHVWVATTIDDETWTGHPGFRFLVKGAKLYNPAKDAALGYEGPNPHVWADPSTHEFTENASVIEYNYRRGIYVTGRHGQAQHLLLGRGLTAEEAPPEAVLPWIALCDELVGGEPRYRAAGVISTADGHDVVAQWLADAMAGHVVQREGGIEVEPGHAKAPVMTITDGDLVVGEKVVFNAFSPDGSTGRYNTIIPRYVEPLQGWQDHSGPVRRDLDDIAEDGGPRELTLPLPLVTWGAQADRCAEIRRRRERLERTATLVLPPRFAALEEGDWINWQSDRRHGGETITYLVEEAELGPNWRQYLVLREISAEVFDDGEGLDDDADPLTPTPQPDAVYLSGVSLYPLQLAASETGAVQPAIRFSWSVPVDAAIVAIRAEVRLPGSTNVASTTTEAVNDGSLPVTQGVLAGAWLEGRLVPLTRTARAALSTPWTRVRVGQGVSDDLTPTGPGRRRVLSDQLDEARARFDADMVAEAEAEGNEALTRDLVDVLAEVNPVQRRALLRAAELDLEGSSLHLLGVASRTELGLDEFGNVSRNIPTDVLNGSDVLRRTGGGLFSGDLTATEGANWGGNLTGRPVELTDGRITTALNASGVLQTAIPSTLADGSNLLRRTGGGVFSGALDANRITNTNELTDGANLGGTANWGSVTSRPVELTDGRVAAGLATNGDLARAIPSALADTSNLLRRTGGGLFSGDLAATAGADWSSNLTNRPVSLTDGRVATALNASGVLQTAIPSTLADTSNILRRTAGGLYTGALDANRITNTNELTDGANLGGTAAWTGTSGRPANLASLAGTEPILNSAISLSAAGVLTGAGTSVQVNLASLPGTVGSTQVADGAVTGAKLADNAVDLASPKVTGKSLANVDSAAATKLGGIAAGATVGATWAGNLTGRPANLSSLAGTEPILNSAITVNANGTLGGAGAGQVTLPGLGAGALATLNTVGAAQIDTGAITSAKLADGSIDIAGAKVTGAGPLATSSLTEAKVRGRYLGAYAGNAAAIAAGLQDGDAFIDTSVIPNALKVQTASVITEVDTAGIRKAYEAQTDVTAEAFTTYVSLALTGIQEGSQIRAWFTMEVETSPSNTRQSIGGTTQPAGNYQIVETGGATSRTMIAGTWGATPTGSGGGTDDYIQTLTIDGEDDALRIATVVSPGIVVSVTGNRTYILQLKKNSGVKSLEDVGLKLFVQVQRPTS